jgi:hypothetical protein
MFCKKQARGETTAPMLGLEQLGSGLARVTAYAADPMRQADS